MSDRYAFQIPGYDPWATADGCTYDADAAEVPVQFFAECLQHVKGEWAGRPFVLDRWQGDPLRALFGFLKPDGTRRYRTVFVYVPRKNGKSTWIAGLAVYVLFCDGEPGAECYISAADRDQASILYGMSSAMILREPELASRCQTYKTSKTVQLIGDETSFLRAISSDSNTKHGYSPHMVVVDELHAQRDRTLVEVLRTGMGARRQPIMVYVTTADYARESICNETLDYARKVRDGIVTDPTFLPVIYEASIEDDWQSEEVWARVNPGYPVSPSRTFLRTEMARAAETPSEENTAKRLYFNIQTQQQRRWISMDDWNGCPRALPEDLAGEMAFCAVDLSSTTDITACVLLFPEHENALLCRFWVTEEQVKRRIEYEPWVRSGHLTVTPGNRIDYGFIREEIKGLAETYVIPEIAYDPWNATQFALEMQDDEGFQMVEFRQGFRSMNEPSKLFEALVTGRELRHGHNPVLTWMASNVAIKEDETGSIKPVKPKRNSPLKVDGIVAAVMCLGRAMAGDIENHTSVYEEKEMLVL